MNTPIEHHKAHYNGSFVYMGRRFFTMHDLNKEIVTLKVRNFVAKGINADIHFVPTINGLPYPGEVVTDVNARVIKLNNSLTAKATSDSTIHKNINDLSDALGRLHDALGIESDIYVKPTQEGAVTTQLLHGVCYKLYDVLEILGGYSAWEGSMLSEQSALLTMRKLQDRAAFDSELPDMSRLFAISHHLLLKAMEVYHSSDNEPYKMHYRSTPVYDLEAAIALYGEAILQDADAESVQDATDSLLEAIEALYGTLAPKDLLLSLESPKAASDELFYVIFKELMKEISEIMESPDIFSGNDVPDYPFGEIHGLCADICCALEDVNFNHDLPDVSGLFYTATVLREALTAYSCMVRIEHRDIIKHCEPMVEACEMMYYWSGRYNAYGEPELASFAGHAPNILILAPDDFKSATSIAYDWATLCVRLAFGSKDVTDSIVLSTARYERVGEFQVTPTECRGVLHELFHTISKPFSGVSARPISEGLVEFMAHIMLRLENDWPESTHFLTTTPLSDFPTMDELFEDFVKPSSAKPPVNVAYGSGLLFFTGLLSVIMDRYFEENPDDIGRRRYLLEAANTTAIHARRIQEKEQYLVWTIIQDCAFLDIINALRGSEFTGKDLMQPLVDLIPDKMIPCKTLDDINQQDGDTALRESKVFGAKSHILLSTTELQGIGQQAVQRWYVEGRRKAPEPHIKKSLEVANQYHASPPVQVEPKDVFAIYQKPLQKAR